MSSTSARPAPGAALDALLVMLAEVVDDRALHARFLNTLARMEYVGVRKMLKARDSARLDRNGLQHVVEEAGHALRLKKLAESLSPEPAAVRGFDEEHTLAGGLGEDYLQRVDAACARALQDVEEARPGAGEELNYLLSSLVIELRAERFYPKYEAILARHGSGLSVASIARDEQRHLADMRAGLARVLPDLDARLAGLRAEEEAAFAAWVDGVRRALREATPRPGP